MLIKKEHRRFIQNVKAFPGEFSLVVAYIDKKKIRNAVRKTCTERRKVGLLKDLKIRKRFEEKVITLIGVGAPNLWGHFKDGILKVCHLVCVWKRGRSKGDTWWKNEDVKEAVSRKKDAHKTMCQNITEDNKRMYKSMKNKVMKAILNAVREKAEEVLTELQNCPSLMITLIK